MATTAAASSTKPLAASVAMKRCAGRTNVRGTKRSDALHE
jgi:hypothetical protein